MRISICYVPDIRSARRASFRTDSGRPASSSMAGEYAKYRANFYGRVAPGNCFPEAPTDPDVRDYRIRHFGPRLRYVTVEGRMRGCGSG
jgi:hypothetical protein